MPRQDALVYSAEIEARIQQHICQLFKRVLSRRRQVRTQGMLLDTTLIAASFDSMIQDTFSARN